MRAFYGLLKGSSTVMLRDKRERIREDFVRQPGLLFQGNVEKYQILFAEMA